MLAGWTEVRPRISREDELWEQTAHYGFFAERYGWTKTEVDAQPHWYTQRLAGFATLWDEVKAEKQKAAGK